METEMWIGAQLRTKHCCENMNYYLNQRCSDGKSPFQCSDTIVIYDPVFDEYGIIIHDGGESFIAIRYCPWCGRKLPTSKRDLWFEELEKRGIENPAKQEIPEEFKSEQWWQSI